MKKILVVLALVISAMCMMAQEITDSINANRPILIERVGNTYYYNNIAMDKRECVDFLAKHNLPIYKDFHSGYTLQRKGWALLGAGVGLEFAGTILTIAGSFVDNDVAAVSMLTLGLTSIVVGSGCEIACIPVLAIGYNRMHECVDYYNIKQINKQQVLSLSINASQNGIGLALKF